MKYILFLSLQLSITCIAHETVEPVSCPVPANTGRITSDMENEMFQAELILYESCMFDYVREQQKLADVHQQAAQKTLDDWNEYLINRMQ